MAKLTMEQYGRVAASVLALPRRCRDMLERSLAAKRAEEDAAKAQGDGQPELPGGVGS